MSDLVERLEGAAKRAAYYQTGEEGIIREAIAALGNPDPKAPTQLFTVRRIPVTAGAKRAAGYGHADFEIEAEDGPAAISTAVGMCEWQQPRDNFSWRVIGSRQVAATQ